MRRRPITVALGLAAALVVAALAVAIGLATSSVGALVHVPLQLASVLAPAYVALLIAQRQPANRIAWALAAVALAFGLFDLGIDVQVAANEEGTWSAAARAVAPATLGAWELVLVTLVALVVLFPDGRLPSPRWRLPARVAVGAWTAMWLSLTFAKVPLDESATDSATNPVGVLSPDGAAVKVFWVTYAIFALSLIAAPLAIRRRWRSAAGVERQQLRWLAYSGLLLPAEIAVGWLGELAGLGIPDDWRISLIELGLVSAVGIAVLRYRLYEIDRLVNRTLVYVPLTLLLGVAFAVVVVGLGALVGGRGGPVPTAAATLVALAVVRPLRGMLQRTIDRRFNRPRYEALRRVERFLAGVRDGREAPENVEGVLREALGDRSLEVRYRLPESGVYVDGAGHVAGAGLDGRRAATPVDRRGTQLGIVLHDPLLAERPDVLRSALDAAGLALEIARLRAEVARQLAEIEHSRDRLLQARADERRRLERDLHDGAQQRLVALGMSLRRVQRKLDTRDAAYGTLDDAVDEVAGVVGELRALARGMPIDGERPVAPTGGVAV